MKYLLNLNIKNEENGGFKTRKTPKHQSSLKIRGFRGGRGARASWLDF
jgi:hypothetical protein